MRPAVRLTRRPEGGFRLEGVVATPIDVVRDATGFVVSGAGPWRLMRSGTDHGWILCTHGDSPNVEIGRTTAATEDSVLAPVSLLLGDGRLFRLAAFGASEPRVELGRWDLSGAYMVGRRMNGAWELERTAAGTCLDAPPELWVLTCVEVGRLDGSY
jgi:hypothetical protein